MEQQKTKTHYKKCVYHGCKNTNRSTRGNVSFHSFPVRNHDVCIRWLVNCGCDEWVEISDEELKKRYICSRHFRSADFHPSGRLKKNAIPIIYNISGDNEKNDNDIRTDKQDNKIDEEETMLTTITKERDNLRQQLQKAERQVEREKYKNAALRAQLSAICKKYNRLNEQFYLGDISDACLKKALARRM